MFGWALGELFFSYHVVHVKKKKQMDLYMPHIRVVMALKGKYLPSGRTWTCHVQQWPTSTSAVDI